MRYPDFTGHEPCATIGPDFYYVEGRGQHSQTEWETMRSACLDRCFMLDECTQWSLHHEQFGFWAGMSEQDRRQLRRRLNIVLSDPVVHVSPALAVPYAS